MAIYDSVKNNPFLLNFAPWNNTIADDTTDEPVDTTSGLAPILYPQGTGEGNQNDGIRQLTNTIPQQQRLTPKQKALFGGYEIPDQSLLVAPGDELGQGYNYLDDEDYLDAIRRVQPEMYKQRKESGFGIPSVISTAFQGAKDFVSNLGKRRQELRDQGYSEDKINFIGANAMGKQFVDEGLYDPMGGYYDSPSGVKDKFNFNVYAKNYMKPGSSSYKKWSTIPNSRAFGMQKEKEKSALEQQISFEKQRAEQEEAARVASVAKAIQQDINRGGRGDRDNTGRNEPGGGRGQSPTGGDVSGTPFKHGGIVGVL